MTAETSGEKSHSDAELGKPATLSSQGNRLQCKLCTIQGITQSHNWKSLLSQTLSGPAEALRLQPFDAGSFLACVWENPHQKLGRRCYNVCMCVCVGEGKVEHCMLQHGIEVSWLSS
eukprot:1143194-Pelagomonas_calceolata.AAC.3